MIKAKAKDITTNQDTDATKKAKEQGILLNAIIYSGNLKAAKELCDLIMERTQIQAESKPKNVEEAIKAGWRTADDIDALLNMI